jgi:hypothetical protein
MGNTGLPQQALKYKPTGRRDRGDREYDGRTKLFSKDRNRINSLNFREVQKKKRRRRRRRRRKKKKSFLVSPYSLRGDQYT